MNESITVLFVEDNLGDARLIQEELRAARAQTFVQLEWVDRLDKGLERINTNPIDAILLDLSLPDSEGLNTLHRVLSHAPRIPVIVMTGQADEEMAVRAVQSGAQDYLIKGEVDGRLLTRSIQYSIQRKQTEQALRESEERFRLVVQSAPSAMIVVDQEGKISLANIQAEELFGYRAHELLGQPIEILIPERSHEVHTAFQHHYLSQPRARAMGARRNLYGLQKDGGEIPLEIGLTPYQSSEGLRVLAMITDITGRKRAEEALQEKERLLTEAQRIGRMGSWTYDIEGDFIQFSDEMYRLFDVIREELHHNVEGFLALIYSADRPVIRGWINDIKIGKQVKELDFRLLHRNDELHYMQARGKVEFSTQGEPVRFTGTMQDITERKLADIQIQQQIGHLTALSEIDRAIISSFGQSYTFGVILAQVISQLHVDAARILLLDSTAQILNDVAARGFHTQLSKTIYMHPHESFAWRAVKEGSIAQILNPTDGTRDPLFDLLVTEEGFVSYVGVPLIAKGKINGVLEVFNRLPLQPFPEWLDFLNILAGQTAIAIENANLFDGLQKSNYELSHAYDATIEGWSRVLDLRDKETEGHTQRVTQVTLRLASAIGIDQDELAHIRRGCLLHDIGKMGVPDSILHKPESLTDEEWKIMRLHPQYAYEMLSPIKFLEKALDIPYAHHEKWDGSGYPRGLKGEEIPFAARLFAVVDTWDALSSDRPYRPRWTKEKVLNHIKSLAGKDFDPRAVEIFLKMYES